VTPERDDTRESRRISHLRERTQAALSRTEVAGPPLGDAARAEVSALIEAHRIYQAERFLRTQQAAGTGAWDWDGGEEFLLALVGVDAPTAARLAEMLRADLADARLGGHAKLPPITVSIGLAMFPDDGRRIEEVIRAADDALSRAKAQGRNRVCMARPQP
jgi:diguanylate cyclase (GGDEF)-like protein